ncbi:hypothetical protein [Neobacillus thermocopriae]|uniref:Uncharacterized protein n=1 Tax=Neobacillus thermocopriae TaxID=1215031 RepID=A0A6B3TRD1_9BACI|nr:hypothetical protein [Neobacillus thermocopriae]MED3625457.1 hypothetical protein [Neobacillus thermocopriae]MED3714626.1 hypothetical protein [Neobacillus thermocopriae]NEX78930.1 hypothetical protein [Neobacillus thermocopriae]
MKRTVILFVNLILYIFLFGSGVQASSSYDKTGEMLDWKKVDKLFPKYSTFTVVDIETGKRFKVQRRAGSRHADVQPMTIKDTKIMKQIYGGKWSWRRRAIIVLGKNKKIAASMHGMPHGRGSLKNNFPGHFCIHFSGSKTHLTNNMDLSHKLMVLKAAGKLEQYLDKATPNDVIDAYIAGMKQQDPAIISRVSLQKMSWKPIFNKVENVNIRNMKLMSPEDQKNEINLKVPVEIEWYLKDSGRELFKGEIHLVRFTPLDSWKVDSQDFLKENTLLN